MVEAGIILEGGAQRGIFTSGLLDYLMEQDFYFSHAIGVSAGCCSGLAYVARQIGWTRDCMIHENKKDGYITADAVLKKKMLFDMDKLFDEFPNHVYPFDYETYQHSPVDSEWVVTNCVTGKPEYKDDRCDRKRLMNICKASSSLPGFSPMVTLDGIPYLDGGITDSIPVMHMHEKGVEKIVVVSTRHRGYRKKRRHHPVTDYYDLTLKDYPEMARAVRDRYAMYNRTMRQIERLESEGKIFVIYPELPLIRRAETRPDVLLEFYIHGKECMKRQMDAMVRYLQA